MKFAALPFLLLITASAALAQQLSAPFSIDAPVVGPAGGNQSSPGVTWTGSDFFVVWSDNRDWRSLDLWFRRLDATAAPLTALSAPLVRGLGGQHSPSLAAGNGSVLVTWLDDTVCASEVMAQRFTTAGQPAGPVLSLSSGACTGDRPSVAWDAVSSQWLVAWGAHGPGRELHGALVSSAGTIALSDFVITTAPNSARWPWVSSAPTGTARFQVSWADDRLTPNTFNVYAVPVSGAGVVGTPVQVAPSAANQSAPCVAPSGSSGEVVISWVEGSSLFAQRADNAGASLGAAQLVSTGPLGEVACAPDELGGVVLAFTDTRATGNGVYLRTLSSSGVISGELEGAPKVSYFNRELPRLALTGDRVLLVARGPWGFVTGNDILGRWISIGSVPGADAGVFLVGNGGTALSHLNAAFDGARYLAVWRDDGQSGAGSDSFGQLLEPGTGRGLVDGGLRLSTSSANLVSFPSVSGSSGDAGFFVTWGDDGSAGQLKGRRVSREGAPSPIVLVGDVSSYVFTHSAQWLSDGWTTSFLKANTLRLRRIPLAGAGAPEAMLVNTNGATEQLDSASLDDVLLTVFLTRDAGLDVTGVRYGADAGQLDPSGFPIAGGPGDQIDPAVGAGATLFLVAWSSGGEVLARRVTREGLVLDGLALPVGVGAGSDLTPAVGWTGTHFLVAWQHDGDVYGARVDENGAVIDAPPLVLANTAELDRSPRITAGPSGETLVTWESFDVPWGTFRLFGRFFSEADAGEVDAGVTVDGGVDDGGSADAGSSDAGEVDAGVDAAPRSYAVGCHCAQVDHASLLLLLALMKARRSRS